MRSCICKRCQSVFYEDDSNPNVHYSQPSDLCRSCLLWDSTPIGGYVQTRSGEYVQKKEQSDD